MNPAKLEKYQITIGDTFEETFLFTDEDDNQIDLTVYEEIQMDIRKGTNVNQDLIYSATLSGGDITVLNINQLDIEISATETATWTTGTYYRDIKFTDGTKVKTMVYGQVIIRENITE
jgi:hypothetical protein